MNFVSTLIVGVLIGKTMFCRDHCIDRLSSLRNTNVSSIVVGRDAGGANIAEDHNKWIDLGGPTIRANFNLLPDESIRSIISMWTLVTPEHITFAKEAIAKINANGVEGDIVECGVWMGGMTMYMIFQNMKQTNHTSRHFWLFDTFEGLPEHSHEKDDPRAKKVYAELQSGGQTSYVTSQVNKRGIIDGKWNYGPIDIVLNNLRYTGYPQENFHLVKGKVEDTLSVTKLPEKIAILRLDTDWYLSTKMELEYMYHRLQSGGVLIIDDYCTWTGSKMATEEFFNETLNLDANSISNITKPCLVYWKP